MKRLGVLTILWTLFAGLLVVAAPGGSRPMFVGQRSFLEWLSFDVFGYWWPMLIVVLIGYVALLVAAVVTYVSVRRRG